MNRKGQNFDEFMKEQNIFEEVKEIASKRLLILQFQEEMKKQNISKSEIARKMHTSRTAVDNILSSTFNTSIGILEAFAGCLGKRIEIRLCD